MSDRRRRREDVITALRVCVDSIRSSNKPLADMIIPEDLYKTGGEIVTSVPFTSRYHHTQVFTVLLSVCPSSLQEGCRLVSSWREGLKKLLRYLNNLLLAPNRPELKTVKVSTSYFHFQVKKNLSIHVAESYLNIVGYQRIPNSTDLTLRNFTLENCYHLVADIIILHEDLGTVEFLISRLNMFSRDLKGDSVSFKHVLLARQYGPPEQMKCLDFIMDGKAGEYDQPLTTSNYYTPSTQSYDQTNDGGYYNTQQYDEREPTEVCYSDRGYSSHNYQYEQYGGRSDQYQGGVDQYQGTDDQYQGRSNQYQGRNNQYQGRNDQYQGRGDQYQGRNDQYQGRNDQYQGRNDQYQGRGGQYQGRNDQYQGRDDQYQGRNDQYQGRGGQYQGRGDQYQGMNDQYQGRNDQYQGRNDQYQGRNDQYQGRDEVYVSDGRSQYYGGSSNVYGGRSESTPNAHSQFNDYRTTPRNNSTASSGSSIDLTNSFSSVTNMPPPIMNAKQLEQLMKGRQQTTPPSTSPPLSPPTTDEKTGQSGSLPSRINSQDETTPPPRLGRRSSSTPSYSSFDKALYKQFGPSESPASTSNGPTKFYIPEEDEGADEEMKRPSLQKQTQVDTSFDEVRYSHGYQTTPPLQYPQYNLSNRRFNQSNYRRGSADNVLSTSTNYREGTNSYYHQDSFTWGGGTSEGEEIRRAIRGGQDSVSPYSTNRGDFYRQDSSTWGGERSEGEDIRRAIRGGQDNVVPYGTNRGELGRQDSSTWPGEGKSEDIRQAIREGQYSSYSQNDLRSRSDSRLTAGTGLINNGSKYNDRHQQQWNCNNCGKYYDFNQDRCPSCYSAPSPFLSRGIVQTDYSLSSAGQWKCDLCSNVNEASAMYCTACNQQNKIVN